MEEGTRVGLLGDSVLRDEETLMGTETVSWEIETQRDREMWWVGRQTERDRKMGRFQ